MASFGPQSRAMRILVTGACGFIGRHIVAALIAAVDPRAVTFTELVLALRN